MACHSKKRYISYLGGISVDKLEEAGHLVSLHERRASLVRNHEIVHGLDEVTLHVGRGGREAAVDDISQNVGSHEPVLVPAVGATTGAGAIINRPTASLPLGSAGLRFAALVVVIGSVILTAEPVVAAAAAAPIDLSLVCALDGVSGIRGCLVWCSCHSWRCCAFVIVLGQELHLAVTRRGHVAKCNAHVVLWTRRTWSRKQRKVEKEEVSFSKPNTIQKCRPSEDDFNVLRIPRRNQSAFAW